MKHESNAWNSFLETGKIDDYLSYCQNRKQEIYLPLAEGASDAADNRWDRSIGSQDR